jgi:predicted O-linked N-acetylglucosamine transferase (SPINDLY family)
VHRSRVVVSLLTAVGLPLVVASEVQYVNIATDLASDIPRLDLRAGLRARMERFLLRDEGVARRLEDAYREMWRGLCDRS